LRNCQDRQQAIPRLQKNRSKEYG